MTNPFFKNYGPLNLKDVYKALNIKSQNNIKKTKIFDIRDLNSASELFVGLRRSLERGSSSFWFWLPQCL